MISANGGLPAHRYTPQVTQRWPRGSEPASAARLRLSVSHASGRVASMAGASTVQCIAVSRANQYARGSLMWWVEYLKQSPSASGVAGFSSGVNVWTLSVVPVAFHCATTMCVGGMLVSPREYLVVCQ